MSSAALSTRNQGFRAQLDDYDAFYNVLWVLFNRLKEFVSDARFMSRHIVDYNFFMANAAEFMSSTITTGITFGVQIPNAAQPMAVPQLLPPTVAQEKNYAAMVPPVGIIVGMFVLLFGSVAKAIPPEATTFGIVCAIIGLLFIASPDLLSQLRANVSMSVEGKPPETFEAWVQEKIGMARVTRTRIGIMRLYRGAFRKCARLESRKHLGLPESSNPFLAEGKRGQYRMILRPIFLARLSEVMMVVERAWRERRTELNNQITEIARPTGHTPQQFRGGLIPSGATA